MTTSRDLFIVATGMEATRPIEPGDLSLALAGAEVIDLLEAQAVELDGDHVVPPNYRPVIADHLLDEAASSLVRQEPYESVGDWLWRRGRNLSAAYLADLEAEGQAIRQERRHWMSFRTSHVELVDSPARRQAEERWQSDEPVLAALGAAVGIDGEVAGGGSGPGSGNGSAGDRVVDDAVATVLAAVDEAVGELAAERQRRIHRREEAAANNRQRGW